MRTKSNHYRLPTDVSGYLAVLTFIVSSALLAHGDVAPSVIGYMFFCMLIALVFFFRHKEHEVNKAWLDDAERRMQRDVALSQEILGSVKQALDHEDAGKRFEAEQELKKTSNLIENGTTRGIARIPARTDTK